jgi:hypothetical protein
MPTYAQNCGFVEQNYGMCKKRQKWYAGHRDVRGVISRGWEDRERTKRSTMQTTDRYSRRDPTGFIEGEPSSIRKADPGPCKILPEVSPPQFCSSSELP